MTRPKRTKETRESLPQFLEAFHKGLHKLRHMLDSYAAKNDDAPALRPLPR